jgi:hypothetical protein
MIYPYEYYGLFYPRIPVADMRPPTLYSILESVVNYEKEVPTKINNLAKEGRGKIFDFDYPLTSNITKENFECMILNHFLMRRIGFETVLSFKIQLNVKLNEIMPMFNKLFDLIYDENGFGEITKRKGFDNRVVDNTSNTTNEMTNVSNTNHQNISDRRGSDTPQNELDNIRQGKYVTEYHYDTDNSSSEDTSTSNGTSQNKTNTKDNNNYEENISKINMLEVFSKLNEEIKNVYSMIFKELDCLFYQLV